MPSSTAGELPFCCNMLLVPLLRQKLATSLPSSTVKSISPTGCSAPPFELCRTRSWVVSPDRMVVVHETIPIYVSCQILERYPICPHKSIV
ncbi:hypothetical protein TIFTF001_018681 [Ficus carica]|uniref:Uncharacterized protein n=1 Tax=Ficus carica TaxID=3494 RepID=A0AA88DAZ4_FICCA|nr:hypothetical protein TIFTF001_018681 [Ficus carica]